MGHFGVMLRIIAFHAYECVLSRVDLDVDAENRNEGLPSERTIIQTSNERGSDWQTHTHKARGYMWICLCMTSSTSMFYSKSMGSSSIRELPQSQPHPLNHFPVLGSQSNLNTKEGGRLTGCFSFFNSTSIRVLPSVVQSVSTNLRCLSITLSRVIEGADWSARVPAPGPKLSSTQGYNQSDGKRTYGYNDQ